MTIAAMPIIVVQMSFKEPKGPIYLERNIFPLLFKKFQRNFCYASSQSIDLTDMPSAASFLR